MCRYIELDAPKSGVGYTQMGTRLVLLNEEERIKVDAFAVIEMYANEKDAHKDAVFLSRAAFYELKKVMGGI